MLAPRRLPQWLWADSSTPLWNSAELVREELFSIERLEAHAASLAAAQHITTTPVARQPLAARLRENESALLGAYRSFANTVDSGGTISPSAGWLLDNYHVVEEQIREIRQDLPPGFYRQLPKLADGPFSGYPRVFGLAWAFVAHTDSRFDSDSLRRFLHSYQAVQPLTIGELWAVAITLRIVLVENLRRAADRSVRARVARAAADDLADRLIGVNGRQSEPDALVAAHADTETLETDFAAQLVQRLRDQDPEVTPARRWLGDRLEAQGTAAAEVVAEVHRRQSAANVTVRNIITSMRLMSDVDWAELFESVSLVDASLRAGSDYPAMDFMTRDQYRRAIEELARRSHLTELEIVARVLADDPDAEAVPKLNAEEAARRRDPGYRLIGSGRAAFEELIGYRRPLLQRPGHFLVSRGTLFYLTGILLISAGTLAAVLWRVGMLGGGGVLLVTLGTLGLVPATDLAVATLNWLVHLSVDAKLLPSLALRDGVPESCRTIVVVPMLLTTEAAALEQVNRLEIHHLASVGGDLHFAVLADGADAAAETMPADAALVAALAAGIERLNKRYPAIGSGHRFYLLHRHRVWDESQQKWMGWERKRGKLHELNRLLRGAIDTTFNDSEGRPPPVPAGVRFVITLDADTRLPRDTVRRLIGKLAHPLNRPRFDPATGRVLEGYSILQPRVTPTLPVGREGSLFQQVFSSTAGIDPYSAAASDVYQDLFGEGSYAGKGIYDIDSFEAALVGRVAPGSLLSHDLFEGLYARAGLVSDVEVVEDFPDRYDVATLRQHRWARGDWQLLPWIVGRPDLSDRATNGTGRLPLISQWKMVDNLRRSLAAPASVAALLVGWALPFHAALVWTSFILLSVVAPPFLPLIAAILPHRAGVTARSHLSALGRDLTLAAARAGLGVTFLAHQAWLMVDAIVRSLFRLLVSHRNLLQWVTAAQSDVTARRTVVAMYWHMRGGVAVGAGVAGVVFGLGLPSWPIALPFALLWLAAPLIAEWASRPTSTKDATAVIPADAHALRMVARRTWRYFEAFVTPADHMLPPDNVQEDPARVVARRTSPTNIGLYLLSIVSARDFGWLGHVDAADRLEATLATMRGMERHRGHFFNWYETKDLRALEPKYVSSVDSGNLAAHLIAVAVAAGESLETSAPSTSGLNGVDDALDLALLASAALPRCAPGAVWLRQELESTFARAAAAVGTAHAAPASLASLTEATSELATLTDVARAIGHGTDDEAYDDLTFWTGAAQRSLESRRRDLSLTDSGRAALRQRLDAIASTAREMASAMEFGFLFDPQRRLLSIGYRALEGTLDSSCYDLLASEARLASFVAIAKGEIPARHWFRLGRAVTPAGGGAALISWSGSMFEYLMPSLVMRAPSGSLLEETNQLVVNCQIAYATALGLPWGISESAYGARDIEFTYQYASFGIPDLGLKRGLRDNAVIAPYATALATEIDPAAAVRNFARLRALGAERRFGFIEALDYTRRRVPADATFATVYAFMAHHQGMTIVAIANALFDGRTRQRFHADPRIQATELLLHERPPRDVSIARPWVVDRSAAFRPIDVGASDVRRLNGVDEAMPQTQLLSNGSYTVMVSDAGAGFSRWRGLAITRWREDPTREDYGSFVYLRDITSGAAWSAGHQPTCVKAQAYDVTFAEDRATIVRRDGTLLSTMEVVVSPEDDAEARRVSITNAGTGIRTIEVTSYFELVLAPLAADIAHPAFSKLFVETEYDDAAGALIATRRRRETAEPEVWVAHHAVIEGDAAGQQQFETDRAKFIGRGCDLRAPAGATSVGALSGTVGTVLDGVFALRQSVLVRPGATARVTFWTSVATSRLAVVDLVDRHREPNAFTRASMLAWTQAQIQLRHLGITEAEASLFQRTAGSILFADRSLRPSSETIARGAGGPEGLWSLGISGSIPIVLARIDDIEDLEFARQLLRAHEYWQSKQLSVDLVIVNERASSYIQDLHLALETATRTGQSRRTYDASAGRGSVFLLRADLISAETRALLSAVARVVLYGPHGGLEDQLDRVLRRAPATPARRWRSPEVLGLVTNSDAAPLGLEFFNGLGGFSADGREYVTVLREGQTTPAPWINVVANPAFGFQVAVEGSGFTWSVNSRENQLSPWSNDPVTDRPGEVIYVRDEETGELWGPTASPIRNPGGTYRASHGQGYSRFEHSSRGIGLELVQFVALEDPIKISRLVVRNLSSRPRRLSVTAYVEWVLGPSRTSGAASIATAIDPSTRVFLARNPWNTAFGARTAFADLGGRQSSWTGDRREFLGRHGSLAAPAALLTAAPLSGSVGAAIDPCSALQAPIAIEPGASVEVVVLLGDAPSAADALSLVARYRAADLDGVFAGVCRHWDELLGAVQVRTPDRALDLMLNRWLLYQTIVCRLWARSAFYQTSGAFGFRDQLQDGMALVASRPEFTRAHLLRAAARQFVEGDVQHWWLPHSGQGVRTHISDDRVWLAFAVAQYLTASGDVAVLEEPVPFLEGQALKAGEHDAFFAPAIADEVASLYEHCARALDQSLVVGAHGLPLMGTGDWNDGMNRVGALGRGESIWLGWLLHASLTAFAPLANRQGEPGRGQRWLDHADRLRLALDTSGWDGAWYRRAFYDDGTALGSSADIECRIDSIAQSWSVISGAATPAHAALGLRALQDQLVRPQDGLALLFTPPFNRTPLDPGYIKAYPPGIRENGGQYTHAAIWTVIALALLGEGDRAAGLFQMLNPISHASTRAAVQRYKVEPYVVAADIYSVAPHVGRGGWTWYTGSAAWMYRAALEWLLGFRLEGASLLLEPCIPSTWPRVEIAFRYRTARYEIVIENSGEVCRGVRSTQLDGHTLPPGTSRIPLVDDSRVHAVRLVLGPPESVAPSTGHSVPHPA
jgi:cyclic beta-1,2-glucan synthetase